MWSCSTVPPPPTCGQQGVLGMWSTSAAARPAQPPFRCCKLLVRRSRVSLAGVWGMRPTLPLLHRSPRRSLLPARLRTKLRHNKVIERGGAASVRGGYERASLATRNRLASETRARNTGVMLLQGVKGGSEGVKNDAECMLCAATHPCQSAAL